MRIAIMVFSATEIWAENTTDETVNIKQVKPILSNYYFYPELFTVASDFCTRNWWHKNEEITLLLSLFEINIIQFWQFHRASASCDKMAANPPINTRKNSSAIIFPRIGILFVKRVKTMTTSHITAIEISSDFDHSKRND